MATNKDGNDLNKKAVVTKLTTLEVYNNPTLPIFENIFCIEENSSLEGKSHIWQGLTNATLLHVECLEPSSN